MIVYVVSGGYYEYYDEEGSVLGVYSTLEKAKEEAELEKNGAEDGPLDWVKIEAWKVD